MVRPLSSFALAAGVGGAGRADGVERLLAWLERRCSRQAVPEVGQELEKFLMKTKRGKMEPMQQWADRFETGYQYLRRAMARALGQAAPVPSSSSGGKPQRPFRRVQAEKGWPWDGKEWTGEYVDALPDDETDPDRDAEEELGDVPDVFPAIVGLANAGAIGP